MILCCGEALIDMIPNAEGAFMPHSGGSVFNTAIALGRLGAPVGMFTGLSTDFLGVQLAQTLQASHVETGLVVRSDRATTLAFVQLTDGHARYTFYDEMTALRMLDVPDLPNLQDAVEALYFGGISLCADPIGGALQALCERETGRVVMIDPNIRPGFIRDEGAYRTRLKVMIGAADIVKTSDEDLAWIYPDISLQDAQQQVMDAGPSVVILTRGSAGAMALTRSGLVEVPAQRAAVVDTVGAGDTFNAGVLAKLSEMGHLTKDALAGITPDAMAEALAFGAQVAAVTVSRAGANPPWRNELDG